MKQLFTKWGRNIDREAVLPEYPREQLRRENWINLNGVWDYAFTAITGADEAGKNEKHSTGEPNSADSVQNDNSDKFTEKVRFPESWEGEILVPFSPETELSGVRRQLKPDEYLWYRRWLHELRFHRKGSGRVLLHFGAVDQSCVVFINGKKAGEHVGGYLPFTLDITELLYDHSLGSADVSKVDDIVVRVRDVSETSYHARGKQKLKRGGMFYTAQSGIWQTVWIEEVPDNYISGLEIHPDIETGFVELTVHAPEDLAVRIFVHAPDMYVDEDTTRMDDSAIMQRVFFTGTSNHMLRMRIPNYRLWTCETPWLYHMDIQMGEDMVTSYFAFRQIDLRKDEKGLPRICLNGKITYLKGVLDQGYWPESLMTPPSDEAMRFDLTEMKKFGFNMVRKHAKIEPDRWYYHCDRLGLLVWQDIVNGGDKYKDWYITYAATGLNWARIHVSDENARLLSRQSEEGKAEFRQEIVATAEALEGHPSVIAWTIFNEAWGQFETEKCTDLLRSVDAERLIDSASGWFDQGCGDFISFHYYYLTFYMKTEPDRAFILSEFGGLPMHLPGHSAQKKIYGYGKRYKNAAELKDGYEELIRRIESHIPDGLCATVYTQWTDIEDEVNGIYTWDREVLKMEAKEEPAPGAQGETEIEEIDRKEWGMEEPDMEEPEKTKDEFGRRDRSVPHIRRFYDIEDVADEVDFTDVPQTAKTMNGGDTSDAANPEDGNDDSNH